MIRKRTMRRFIAFFLIIVTVSNIFLPTLSLALTSGPTAPEATSFEPVDTTDLVNLSSGDLAYNIPLLEVPGPAGSYPLSLSYHAGIQPNEDASWVGLGWTLNPGAILRNVNGYADDQKDALNISRYYWKGGVTRSYEIGVTAGVEGSPGSVSFGLSYSQDTFQGNGIGFNLGAGADFGGGFGLSASVGIDPYGNSSAGAGLNLSSSKLSEGSMKGISASAGIGISTNFNSVSGYASGGITATNERNTAQGSLLGASISTGKSGVSGSAGVLGIQIPQNSRVGRISSTSNGVTIPIPTPVPGVFLSLGYNVQRYWIDEVDKTIANGALYFPSGIVTKDFLDDHAFDSYSLKDPADRTNFLKDPERSLGGTLPGYDNYYVHAQGLGGSFKPYYFQKFLMRKNKYQINQSDDKEYQSMGYMMGNDSRHAEFRFVNDFSNRFEYNPSSIVESSSTTTPMSFAFSGSPTTGESGTDAFVASANNLPGSRNITWLTNSEVINTNSAKRIQSRLMDAVATGFNRASLNPDLIGAYVITNESGVKYHFALPAMSSNEYYYSENTEDVLTFNEFKKESAYAYTWYLTGVTGPDYVDRGPTGAADGVLNEYDWGYWVQMEYGKWTDHYAWRNPGAGLDADIDTKFKSFSEGVKELYYLDAIRTATHTALFIKDIRNDAKSSLRFLRDIIQDREGINSLTKAGSYIPKNATCTCFKSGRTILGDIKRDLGSNNYTARPTSTLKLNKVILIKNDELDLFNVNKSKGDQYGINFNYNWTINENEYPPENQNQCDFSPVVFNQHLYQNVLDIHDENYYFGSLVSKALRIIDFETDYSLSPETSNSFSSTLVQSPAPPTDESSYTLDGKLTLKSLKFRGKSGTDLIPPLKFNYDSPDPIKINASLSQEAGIQKYSFVLANSGLVKGDIITASSVYCTIVDIDPSNKHTVRVVGKNLPAAGVAYNWQTTKNPPYNKDFYDIWGHYKSDFIPFVRNENLQRMPSAVSSKAVDVWSLRSVGTSTGASMLIEYESDRYDKSIFYKNFSLPVSLSVEQDPNIPRPEPDSPITNPVVFAKAFINQESDIKYNELYSVGTDVDLVAMYGTCTAVQGGSPNCSYGFAFTGKVQQATSTSLKVRTTIPHNSLNEYYGGQMYFGSSVYNHGGGIRVKSIGIDDKLTGRNSFTHYEYLNGVTSYEPVKIDQYTLTGADPIGQAEFAYNINYGISNLVALGNFIPAPGVMYEKVRVTEKISQKGVESTFPNYTEYDFEAFDEDMVQISRSASAPNVGATRNFGGYVDYDRTQTRNITIKDFSTKLGSLKRTTVFDGAGKKMLETTNHYLFDQGAGFESALAASYNNQGVIEETFAEAMFARVYHLTFGELDRFSLNGMITKKEEYPSIQTGQTAINYKTGITTTSSNIGFDFYSGQVIRSLTTDGYGNSYITETTPAYRKYGEMGQMALGGKNMLIQEAGSSVFKIDHATQAKVGLVSSSVQTWSKNLPILLAGDQAAQNIYRKRSSFMWEGNDVSIGPDGLYPYSSFISFDGWSNDAPTSSQWLKSAEVTLYDPHSHALEAADINGNLAATKMSLDQSRVVASVANAGYAEFAFAGAEEVPGAGGALGGGVVFKGEAYSPTTHTGKFSAVANPSIAGKEIAFSYSFTAKPRTYHVSVWSNQANANIAYKIDNGARQVASVANRGNRSGNWYLLEADVTVTGTPALEVWCEANGAATLFDDFRVNPLDAAMTSYVYNEWGELSHILDNNNLYTEYRYDGMGRLTGTYRETLLEGGQPRYGNQGLARVNEIQYNYGASATGGSNSPFAVTITASHSGTSGTITPSGVVSLRQGGEQIFTIAETCATPKFLEVLVDGNVINLATSSQTLYEGALLLVSGKTLTFKNIRGDHTVQARFVSAAVGTGNVQCAIVNGCRTGFFDYYEVDGCGVQHWSYSMPFNSIPPGIKPSSPPNCCALNDPGNNCLCTTPQQ